MIGDKKAEVTSFHLIALVLSVMGFIIALLLLYSLEFNSYSDDEICRLSVLSRGTAPLGSSLIPLKCTTGKICLTFGSDCEQFKGEKDVTKIKLSKTNVKSSAFTIEKVSAEEMYNCWNMMGQGKIDLFSGRETSNIGGVLIEKALGWSNNKVSSCFICSRVALSKDITDSNEGKNIMKEVNVNDYMEKEKVPGTNKNYIEVFTDDFYQSYPQEFEKNLRADENSGEINQLGIVFMMIRTEKGYDSALENGGFAIVGSSATGLYFGGPWGALFGAFLGLTDTTSQLFSTWNGRGVSEAYCGKFTSSAEKATQGCSIVTGMDYSRVAQINKFCSIVEGNP